MKNSFMPFNRVAQVAAIGFVVAAMAACNDSNKSSGSNHDDHDHGALLVSHGNSISHLDEGSVETLDNISFNATFVRSDNGEFAALKGDSSATPRIYFAGEDGLTDHDVLGTEVIATNGHFSVFNAGSSTFIEVESLEEDTFASENAVDFPLTEVYPAVLLDEADDIVLVFTASGASIYEEGGLVTTVGTAGVIACTDPSSVAQAGHAVIMTCTEGVTTVHVEEGVAGIDYHVEDIALMGSASSYEWQAAGHVFAGFVAGTTDYALIHFEEDEVIEPGVGVDDGAALSGNICAAAMDATDGDFLFWLKGGTFAALTNEGESISEIAVDTSTSNDCADFYLAATAKAAYVIDTDAGKFYHIDVHEDATAYHVHETLDTTVTGVNDSVALFHNEGGDHDHEEDEHAH